MAQPAAAPELLNDIICQCKDDCDYSCIIRVKPAPLLVTVMNYNCENSACATPLTVDSTDNEDDEQ